MKKLQILVLFCATLVISCRKDELKKDATGVFEATEVIVSAESTGRLLSFEIQEGQALSKGQVIGQIDTVQLALKKQQLQANQLSLKAEKPDIASRISASKRELDQLKFEKERIQRLLEGDVATQKQLDDINAQIDVLTARIEAQKRQLNSATDAIEAQSQAVQVQFDQLSDQIDRCAVKSPIDGLVLLKYTEPGEFVNTGKPLFKVADMKKMILRAYVTGDQLKDIQVGQKVSVLAELGAEEDEPYEGVITWISEKSEFTPKTIQTRDERANLVYAVKIAVENEGMLKIGMYGGVKWTIQ